MNGEIKSASLPLPVIDSQHFFKKKNIQNECILTLFNIRIFESFIFILKMAR